MRNKTVTILVLIIVILLAVVAYMAIGKQKETVMIQQQATIEQQQTETVPQNTTNPQSTQTAKSYDLSFFKPELEKMPDSEISQCTISGKTYFEASYNKLDPQYNEYAVGGSIFIYQPDGTLVNTCTLNNRSDFCMASREASCTLVYSTKNSMNHTEKDTYHIYN